MPCGGAPRSTCRGVIADTIFQAVINVELGVWNVSQPDL